MKEKEESVLEVKIKNLTFIVLIGFIVLTLLIVGLYFKDNNESKTTATNKTPTTTSTDYDVSKMKAVTGDEATKLFDEKGTHILYIGRPTCSICVSLVPELNKVIEDSKITINYLELGQNFRTDFGDLFDHLDIETTINKKEGTYGELLKENGYTPIVVIIKDGKMVDGFVGVRSSEDLTELFEKYL